MKTKIVNETSVSFAEVKQILEHNKELHGELSFTAQKAYDYLEQFSHLDKKKTDELFKKLTALEIPRLKEMHINKLIDILPKDQRDVRTILQAYSVTVSNENLKKISDVIGEVKF